MELWDIQGQWTGTTTPLAGPDLVQSRADKLIGWCCWC